MHAVTIREAKARLNSLVEAALAGEDVVLLRGSRHVAAIIPITDADLELAPRLTDAQAQRLWAEIAAERAQGRSAEFETPDEAVASLARRVAPVSRKRTRSR